LVVWECRFHWKWTVLWMKCFGFEDLFANAMLKLGGCVEFYPRCSWMFAWFFIGGGRFFLLFFDDFFWGGRMEEWKIEWKNLPMNLHQVVSGSTDFSTVAQVSSEVHFGQIQHSRVFSIRVFDSWEHDTPRKPQVCHVLMKKKENMACCHKIVSANSVPFQSTGDHRWRKKTYDPEGRLAQQMLPWIILRKNRRCPWNDKERECMVLDCPTAQRYCAHRFGPRATLRGVSEISAQRNEELTRNIYFHSRLSERFSDQKEESLLVSAMEYKYYTLSAYATWPKPKPPAPIETFVEPLVITA